MQSWWPVRRRWPAVVSRSRYGSSRPHRECYAAEERHCSRLSATSRARCWGVLGEPPPCQSKPVPFETSARKARAVLRVAPFVGLLYSTLVLWFLEGAHASPLAKPPLRPWYPNKQSVTFEDILRTARYALARFDVLVPSPYINNLRKLDPPSRKQQPPSRRQASAAAETCSYAARWAEARMAAWTA